MKVDDKMKKILIVLEVIVLVLINFIIFNNSNFSLSYISDGQKHGTYEDAQKIIKEVMKDFYIKGPLFQYNYAKTTYGVLSPEDATSQDNKHVVCAAYTTDVYHEAFGMKRDSNDDSYYFPYYNFSILDEGEKYYKDNKSNSNKLKGQYLIYFEKGKTKYVYGDSDDFSKFVKQLKPGDLLAYTGHAMIVYDIVKNPNTGKLDALCLNSGRTGMVVSRIDFSTSKVSYDKFASSHGKNNVLDISKEGSIKYFWLSENSKFVTDGKLTCSKERCSIIRPFYKDSNGNAAFNYKIDSEYYNKSKLRIQYPGIYIVKTVDKGDNDSVNLGDELKYTIKIINRSGYSYDSQKYKKFYVEETLGDYVEYVTSNGTYKDGKITWTVSSLSDTKTKTLTYTVKVKKNYKNINKLIVAKGKFYNDSTAYLTTGEVENRIVNRITKYNDSYANCYKKYKSNVSGLKLMDSVVECSTGYNPNFKTNFNFDKIFTRKNGGESHGTKNVLVLKKDPDANSKVYMNMILNNYWGGLGNYKKDGKAILSLPRWSGDSALRNRNINISDFKDGDILIYNISDSKYTKENGTYAFMYIGDSFVGINHSGKTTQRNAFTFNYYKSNYEDSELSKVFYSKYSKFKNDTATLNYINYLTLYDKNNFVILRPELVIEELVNVKINKAPKKKYKRKENIDLSEGTALLSYSNGTSKEIGLNDSGIEVKTFDTSNVGTSTVELKYGDFIFSYNIGVEAEPVPEPTIIIEEPIPTPPEPEVPTLPEDGTFEDEKEDEDPETIDEVVTVDEPQPTPPNPEKPKEDVVPVVEPKKEEPKTPTNQTIKNETIVEEPTTEIRNESVVIVDEEENSEEETEETIVEEKKEFKVSDYLVPIIALALIGIALLSGLAGLKNNKEL